MEDKPNYYAILGISSDAPDAGIRRAYRARAKELHPDSKPAAEQEAAICEFNLLTEAYETLKDPGRRQAYDAETIASRQLALRAGAEGRRPRAFAMGLGLGLLLAAAAVGAKVYYDRSGIGSLPKSQESLSTQKLEKPSTPLAVQEEKEEKSAAAAAAPASPGNSADRLPASAGNHPAKPAGGPGHRSIQLEEAQARPAPAAAPQALSPAISSAPREEPGRERSGAQHSQFALEVLSLEGEVGSGGDGAAAYRLVSLVNAADAIEELNEAASLASKPETVDLIQSRIAALREERGAAPSRPSYWASEEGSRARFRDDGAIEAATGAPGNETVLRLRPGDGSRGSFSDCASCPEMVAIPGGQIVIGSRPESAAYRPDEAPVHKISIRLPIAVSKHAISAENWRTCVEAGSCRPTLASYLSAGPGVPATRVSWFDAKSYAEWLSQRTGRRYRLLSEAEWEYAARAGKSGVDAAARPDSALGGRSLILGPLRSDGLARSWAGAKPNAWGLYPLPGDLLEWVEDCWHGNYAQAPADGSPWLSAGGGDCAYRVVRGIPASGGEFGGKRIAARAREFSDERSPTLGFRVARELYLPARTALDSRAAPAVKNGRGE